MFTPKNFTAPVINRAIITQGIFQYVEKNDVIDVLKTKCDYIISKNNHDGIIFRGTLLNVAKYLKENYGDQ